MNKDTTTTTTTTTTTAAVPSGPWVLQKYAAPGQDSVIVTWSTGGAVHALVETPDRVYHQCTRELELVNTRVSAESRVIRAMGLVHPGVDVVCLSKYQDMRWADRMRLYVEAGAVPCAFALWAERHMVVPQVHRQVSMMIHESAVSVLLEYTGNCIWAAVHKRGQRRICDWPAPAPEQMIPAYSAAPGDACVYGVLSMDDGLIRR